VRLFNVNSVSLFYSKTILKAS